jgi:hypothetical protein
MKNLLRFILNYCEFTNQSFSLIFTPNIASFLPDFLGNNEDEKLKLFWQFNDEDILLNSLLNCQNNLSFSSSLFPKKSGKNEAIFGVKISEKDWFVNSQ